MPIQKREPPMTTNNPTIARSTFRFTGTSYLRLARGPLTSGPIHSIPSESWPMRK
jgi:hypothetical protein